MKIDYNIPHKVKRMDAEQSPTISDNERRQKHLD